MVQLSSRAHALDTSSILAQTNSASSTSSTAATGIGSAGSSASFESELEAAIQGALSQSGNGSQFEIDIQSGQSSSGGSDYTITVKNLGSAGTGASSTSASTASSTTTLPPASTTPMAVASPAVAPNMMLAGLVDASTPVPASNAATSSNATASAVSANAAAIAKSQMTPDQAYWAEQPPAVQALQNMDPAERPAAAQQLAQQGYAIDVPIMVWGWDPLTTMIERQNYGYTWVPSATQSPVAAPGANDPALPEYDANHPPAGSIPVSTDFAAGTNMQNQFVDAATIQASFSSAVTGSGTQSQPTTATQAAY